MKEKQIEKKQVKTVVKKRVYTPPTLTVFGKLADLTAGGKSGLPETNPTGQPNKRT